MNHKSYLPELPLLITVHQMDWVSEWGIEDFHLSCLFFLPAYTEKTRKVQDMKQNRFFNLPGQKLQKVSCGYFIFIFPLLLNFKPQWEYTMN